MINDAGVERCASSRSCSRPPLLGIEPKAIPVITRDDMKRAKPDPDLFLAAADRLHVDITSSVIIGDSIWDMLAARRARPWRGRAVQAF